MINAAHIGGGRPRPSPGPVLSSGIDSNITVDTAHVNLLKSASEGGTPGRGKAFHGDFGQHAIEDHSAVLLQFASERPFMDLERVDAFGHSIRGYGVLRALLLAPDLYRVGVASAPGVDLADFRVWFEPYMGLPASDCFRASEHGSSTRCADLLHGTSDVDVPFGEIVRFVDALHLAGKPHYAVIFPEAHLNLQGPHWWQRVTR